MALVLTCVSKDQCVKQNLLMLDSIQLPHQCHIMNQYIVNIVIKKLSISLFHLPYFKMSNLKFVKFMQHFPLFFHNARWNLFSLSLSGQKYLHLGNISNKKNTKKTILNIHMIYRYFNKVLFFLICKALPNLPTLIPSYNII